MYENAFQLSKTVTQICVIHFTFTVSDFTSYRPYCPMIGFVWQGKLIKACQDIALLKLITKKKL